MKEFEYVSRADGWKIHAYRWDLQPNRGVVVISHGMAEHALRYDRFAGALNLAGFEVWAMDHRAHGRTLGPEGFGDFGEGGWDGLVDDIDQLIEIAAAANPGKPMVLFGHSMGAGAAQHYAPAGSGKLTALILSGTTLRNPDEPAAPFNASFEPSRTKYDWLSRDEAEVDKYIEDPLCGFEGQTVRSGFNRNDRRRVDMDLLRKIRPDLPVLLVAGDADPVNGKLKGIDYLESMWRAAGVRRIDRHIYPGGRHEMLNEINRDEVTGNIVDWMDEVI